MDYTKFEDQVLVRLISKKDEKALGELYDRLGRLVYSIALKSIGDPALAEEITQDVFFRVWRNASSYRVELGRVVTWISGITRNRAIDEIRRMNVRPESSLAPWDSEGSYLTDENSDIEAQIEVSQSQKRVQLAVAQLPPEQQEVLAYAYFQGFSHREISDLLNQPLGTVKTRIRLAMNKLRKSLETDP